MLKNLGYIVVCAVLAAPQACAASLQLIASVPGTYTPGEHVAFQLILPAVKDLGSYNIDLVLEGDRGNAGVDFYFDLTASAPAPTNYVFPSKLNYFDAINVDSNRRHRLTLTDFDFDGVDVASGINDLVAQVVLRTAPDFDGVLSLFVDADSLILDTPALSPTPVAGFSAIQAEIAASPVVVLPPVPEPSAIVLLVFAALAGLERRRLAGDQKLNKT